MLRSWVGISPLSTYDLFSELGNEFFITNSYGMVACQTRQSARFGDTGSKESHGSANMFAVVVMSALSFTGIGDYYNAYAQDNRNNNNNNNNLDVQITEPTPELTGQWWQWIMVFSK